MTAVTECASARSVCPVRRVLTERFRILLDRHNLKFLNCIDRMGLDEAVKRTQPEFDECVAARGAVEHTPKNTAVSMSLAFHHSSSVSSTIH
jgi:hypothetical protein